MNPTEAGPRALDVRTLDAGQIRALYADLYRAILPPRFYDRWVVVRGLHGQ